MRVETYDGPSAAPCAAIIMTGLSNETRVQVMRTVEGRTATVRGGRDLMVLGAGSLVDYDVPLGVDVTYTVATPGSRLTATYRVDSEVGWISDPYDPSVAISVTTTWDDPTADLVMRAGTALSATRDTDVETVQVLGDPYPVAVTGTRRAAAQVPMDLMTLTGGGRAAMDRVAASGALAVLRLPPSQRIRVLAAVEYVAFSRVSETHRPTADGQAFSTLSGEMTAVRPLTRAVEWVAWTYESALAAAVNGSGVSLTYAQVASLAQLAGWSWADYARDPTIGGAL